MGYPSETVSFGYGYRAERHRTGVGEDHHPGDAAGAGRPSVAVAGAVGGLRCRFTGQVDFGGEELEPFQVELVRTLGVEPVNYEPIGPVREAAVEKVRQALENPQRDDELTAKARDWYERRNKVYWDKNATFVPAVGTLKAQQC